MGKICLNVHIASAKPGDQGPGDLTVVAPYFWPKERMRCLAAWAHASTRGRMGRATRFGGARCTQDESYGAFPGIGSCSGVP